MGVAATPRRSHRDPVEVASQSCCDLYGITGTPRYYWGRIAIPRSRRRYLRDPPTLWRLQRDGDNLCDHGIVAVSVVLGLRQSSWHCEDCRGIVVASMIPRRLPQVWIHLAELSWFPRCRCWYRCRAEQQISPILLGSVYKFKLWFYHELLAPIASLEFCLSLSAFLTSSLSFYQSHYHLPIFFPIATDISASTLYSWHNVDQRSLPPSLSSSCGASWSHPLLSG